MEFLDPLLEKYVCEHTANESDLLKKINRETHLEVLQPRMLSGHFQGRVLSMFSKMIRPERILEIQKKSNLNVNLLDKITVSRVTNTSEQINSIKNLEENNFSLIVIDNVTDLFSYEYKNNKSIFEKNALFMKYMRELSSYAITHKIPIVVTNMIRSMNDKEVENMANAIDLFTHIKIHLFKNSSVFNGEIYSAFKKESFSYEITSSGVSSVNF